MTITEKLKNIKQLPIILMFPLILLALVVTFFILNLNESTSINWHTNSAGSEHKIKVYKSPTCGCCAIHADYLQRQGYKIEREITEDMEAVKHKYGIPRDLWSCHTTVVNDGEYYVEGHIPNEAIEKLLEEEPHIAGIGMPGMPSGSPGMPGPKHKPFEIMQVDADNEITLFKKI